MPRDAVWNHGRSQPSSTVNVWLTFVVSLFVAACIAPAFSDPEWGVHYGYQCLLMVVHPIWIGNLFFFIGIGVAIWGEHKESIPFALISLIFAAWFASSAGHDDRLLIGTWLWIASFVALLGGAILIPQKPAFVAPSEGQSTVR